MKFLSRLGKHFNKKFQETILYEDKVKSHLSEARKLEAEIKLLGDRIRDELTERENNLVMKEKAIEKIYQEKTIGFPWLVDAISEFEEYFDLEAAKHLRYKKHKAVKASDIVKKISKEKKNLTKELKITKNYIAYYESLFPWLKDYIDEELDSLLLKVRRDKAIEEDEDPVKIIIGDVKYSSLNSKERNQLALDIYLRSRTNWQIGRDYERYIGFIYESKGYDVSYQGIIEGYEDLGRDLVCKKGNTIEVIQCKCWSRHKVIREKHINQLYGTTVKYMIDHGVKVKKRFENSLFPESNSEVHVKPVFVTSTKYSEVAKKFAEALGVELIENMKLVDYPLIKCNISKNGEKIYHLPFDQQYDKIRINKPDRFYISTVAEAEEKGYRRAYRWKGKSK